MNSNLAMHTHVKKMHSNYILKCKKEHENICYVRMSYRGYYNGNKNLQQKMQEAQNSCLQNKVNVIIS